MCGLDDEDVADDAWLVGDLVRVYGPQAGFSVLGGGVVDRFVRFVGCSGDVCVVRLYGDHPAVYWSSVAGGFSPVVLRPGDGDVDVGGGTADHVERGLMGAVRDGESTCSVSRYVTK